MARHNKSFAVGRCLFFVDVACSLVTAKTQGVVMPVCDVCRYFEEYQETHGLNWLHPQRHPQQVVKGECLLAFGVACRFVVGDEWKDWKTWKEGQPLPVKPECRECSTHKALMRDAEKEEEFLSES